MKWITLSIQWIAWFVLSTLIRWIVIYPVDSVIQPLNNRGLYCRPTSCCHQSAETIRSLNYMISVHEVFTLLLGNNFDSASRDSDTDCAAVPFPNKGSRVFSQSQSGVNILRFFHRFQPRFGRRRRSEIDRLQVDMKYSGRRRSIFYAFTFF